MIHVVHGRGTEIWDPTPSPSPYASRKNIKTTSICKCWLLDADFLVRKKWWEFMTKWVVHWKKFITKHTQIRNWEESIKSPNVHCWGRVLPVCFHKNRTVRWARAIPAWKPHPAGPCCELTSGGPGLAMGCSLQCRRGHVQAILLRTESASLLCFLHPLRGPWSTGNPRSGCADEACPFVPNTLTFLYFHTCVCSLSANPGLGKQSVEKQSLASKK